MAVDPVAAAAAPSQRYALAWHACQCGKGAVQDLKSKRGCLHIEADCWVHQDSSE